MMPALNEFYCGGWVRHYVFKSRYNDTYRTYRVHARARLSANMRRYFERKGFKLLYAVVTKDKKA